MPAKAAAAGKTFVATVKTTCGDLTFELDGAKAPQTVASFINLAKTGYWAPSPCHRVTTEGIYVLQCGDPTGTGQGGPGYTFGIENAPKDGKYPTGVLAMARTRTRTATAASSSSPTRKPSCPPTAVATRSSGR